MKKLTIALIIIGYIAAAYAAHVTWHLVFGNGVVDKTPFWSLAECQYIAERTPQATCVAQIEEE